MGIIPDRKRHSTQYPGVVWRWAQRANAKRGQLERVYYVHFWRDGKKVEAKVGRQFSDDMTPARAASVRAQFIEHERYTPQEKRQKKLDRLTIERLWNIYDAEHREGRQVRTNRGLAQHLAPLMDSTPHELTTAGLQSFADELLKSKAPQTVKHVLYFLKRLIRYAAKLGLCSIPVRLIFPTVRVDNTVTECLTQDEIKRLLTALDEDYDQNLAAMMRLALFTGIRRSALLALQWPDIDLERGFVTLRGEHAKNKKTSRLPLSRAAMDVIRDINPTPGSLFLFPGRNGGLRTSISPFLKRIRELAELPENFRPLHGLRHTFASNLASNGQVDLYTLQRLLTHESPTMTARYAHLADEAMRRAADVAGKMFQQGGESVDKSSTCDVDKTIK